MKKDSLLKLCMLDVGNIVAFEF